MTWGFCTIFPNTETVHDKGDLAKLSFTCRAIIQDEDCSSAVCCGAVCVERHTVPENLRFQRSELWWIKGKQQEGYGDSTKGTQLYVYIMIHDSNIHKKLDSWWIFLLFVLLPRFFLGATCVSFRRYETLKERQSEPWLKILTGTCFCHIMDLKNKANLKDPVNNLSHPHHT